MPPKPASACPCQSGRPRAQCCGPLLTGEAQADNALSLMRSRYSAFSEGNSAYLLASWDPSTRPAKLDLSEGGQAKWIGLKIVRHEEHAAHAVVEFIARYRIGGRAQRLHESSRFSCRAGRWYYIDGEIHD